MKISIENIRHYDNMSYKSKVSNKEADAAAVKPKQDQVFIGSSSPQIEDKKIAEELAHNVIQDVRQATPQDKIESLKRQVAEGTYRPDVDMIASRILLGKGLAENE